MLWGGIVLIVVGAFLIIAAVAPGIGYALVVVGAIIAVLGVFLDRRGPRGTL